CPVEGPLITFKVLYQNLTSLEKHEAFRKNIPVHSGPSYYKPRTRISNGKTEDYTYRILFGGDVKWHAKDNNWFNMTRHNFESAGAILGVKQPPASTTDAPKIIESSSTLKAASTKAADTPQVIDTPKTRKRVLA